MNKTDGELAGRIREDILDLFCQIETRRVQWKMSKPPPGLKRAWDALRDPEYDIVICGEVKRGKSSFVNALIGKDLLPTGVKETTSQVFRISADENESFALVFEDGHREEIGREGLARYGSQAATDLEGMPLFRGRSLRWIEVKTPGVFLPEGVHLVDTPGLGALYAAHSEITARYIAKADAVIYTIDSGQPLTESEKKFLERCMEVTPNILFIQTKIDTKSEDEWRAIQKRTETLLNAAFHKDGRAPFRVFPVSSTLLAESAREENEQERAYLLEDSLFDAARRGLELVMFRATGWTRCAWATAEASHYAENCRRALEEQLKVLVSVSASEKEELRKKKVQVRTEFQKQWGAEGAKRNQFMSELNRIMQGVRSSALYIGAQGTELYSSLTREISNLATREAVETFARDMPVRVQSGVAREWQEIMVSSQKQIGMLDKSLPMLPEPASPFYVNLPIVTVKEPSIWDRVKNTNIDGMVGGSLAALAAGFFLTGGIATAAIAFGTILGASRGYSRILNQQLEAARNELRQQLAALLAQCRNALCAADMKHGNPVAKMDAFIEETQIRIKNTLEEQFAGHRERMEEQETKLEVQSKLTGRQRDSEIDLIRENMEQINAIHRRLQEIVAQLRKLQDGLNRAEAEL